MYCNGTQPFYSQDSYSEQFQVILQQLPIGALHMHKYILLESIFSVTINACPYILCCTEQKTARACSQQTNTVRTDGEQPTIIKLYFFTSFDHLSSLLNHSQSRITFHM